MRAGLGLDGEPQKPWEIEDIIVDLPDDVVDDLDRPSNPGEEGDFAAIERAVRIICEDGHANGWPVSFQRVDSALERFRAYQRLADSGENVRGFIRRICASVKRSRSNGHAAPADKAEPEPAATQVDVAALANLELSDTGNADRLLARFGNDLLYAPHAGWHAWDGRRWQRDDCQHAVVLAQQTARLIFSECQHLADKDDQKARAKWAVTSQNKGRIDGMLAMALPHRAVTPDELDANGDLLNVLSGTIDTRTGELCPHRRADRLTGLAPVTYDPDALAPNWLAFLDAVFAGDVEVIAFVQRAVGYSLTGDCREQCLFLLHGAGSNGKSTLLKILGLLLGDYAQQTPTDTFMAKDRGGGIPNDIARLKGARLVAAVETDDGRRLAEGLVKQATGGDKMAARFLRKEFFEFTPSFKLWLAFNHKPEVKGTDHAMWRRIRLIPFGVRFWKPDDEDFIQRPEGAPLVDTGLEERLRAELPGILAWAVRGCLAWRRDGLKAPATVLAATAAYRAEMDRLGDFLAERCLIGPVYSVKASVIYGAYTDWCNANGENALSLTKFGNSLTERGFGKERSGGIVRRGLALRDETGR